MSVRYPTREAAEAAGITRLLPPGDPWATGEGARRPSKYHSHITEYGGIKYHSKAEANRAYVLDLDRQAGLILGWERQVRIELGVPENVIVIDFVVTTKEGTHAEDVKGYETMKFRHDRKLWAKYGPCPLWIIDARGRVLEVIEGGGAKGDQP